MIPRIAGSNLADGVGFLFFFFFFFLWVFFFFCRRGLVQWADH